MKCATCNTEKPDYHFFKHRNKYDKTFFTDTVPQSDDVCWSCAGPYKCLGCGEVKGASEFRVGGRYCHDCKSVGITQLVGLKSG